MTTTSLKEKSKRDLESENHGKSHCTFCQHIKSKFKGQRKINR